MPHALRMEYLAASREKIRTDWLLFVQRVLKKGQRLGLFGVEMLNCEFGELMSYLDVADLYGDLEASSDISSLLEAFGIRNPNGKAKGEQPSKTQDRTPKEIYDNWRHGKSSEPISKSTSPESPSTIVARSHAVFGKKLRLKPLGQ